jgi:3-oxoacyl-[acyl-carrier-protein] synthase-1
LSSGGLSRRVVVTGYGIISSIGNDRTEVLQSLRCGRSGIEHNPEYADLGFRSQVHGPIRLDMAPLIDRKIRRFMGDGAAYGYLAMREAIAHAGLTEDRISDPRIGLVMGSGGPSTANIVAAADTLRDRGLRKVSAFVVPRAMSSTGSACLSTAYRIQGVSYSISSACATSAHCVGHGAELIGLGKQDIVFAGGCEEVHWTQSVLFDAMGALSSRHNETPRTASRPYDVDRDGFVISGGGGLLVLEELEHALARGAPIVAELVGYGASSDG